jgi:hypothetical protein
LKRFLLILISFAWLPFIPEEARACSCKEYEVPVCAAYWRADAVLVGELLEITPVEKTTEIQIPTVMLHFIVEQPFRGVAGNRVDVQTLHGTSCDMKFENGKRYLIYASRAGEGNQLFAGPCTRTTELKYAIDDLNYIRTVTQQEAQESILGRLVRNKYEPLPGLKVTVQSGDKTVEAKTNEKGDFSVSVPAPGTYTVRAFLPFAAAVMAYQEDEQGKIAQTETLTTFEYEVQLAKSQCHYRQIDTFKIDLHASAQVAGNVLTASDRPVSPGYVYLVNTADPDHSDFRKLDDNGSFKFEGVAAGEYYLVLNPRNRAPDEDDAPYPTTYYPDAAEARLATKIVLTEGTKLENLTLRVGPRLKERMVNGTVVWQDERSLQNVRISLYDGDRYVRSIKLDEKGRFNFKVYGDFKYAIIAEAWGAEHGKSDRLSITKEKSIGLKLVLKRVD